MRKRGPSLEFRLLGTPLGKKTQVWRIHSTRTGVPLGYIQYHTNWRQYVFIPDNRTLYANDCMGEIAEFLTKLKEERKAIKASAQA